jgi:hypothetical protein
MGGQVRRRSDRRSLHCLARSYRQLLDRWRMWNERIRFDVARAQMMGPNAAAADRPQVAAGCT